MMYEQRGGEFGGVGLAEMPRVFPQYGKSIWNVAKPAESGCGCGGKCGVGCDCGGRCGGRCGGGEPETAWMGSRDEWRGDPPTAGSGLNIPIMDNVSRGEPCPCQDEYDEAASCLDDLYRAGYQMTSAGWIEGVKSCIKKIMAYEKCVSLRAAWTLCERLYPPPFRRAMDPPRCCIDVAFTPALEVNRVVLAVHAQLHVEHCAGETAVYELTPNRPEDLPGRAPDGWTRIGPSGDDSTVYKNISRPMKRKHTGEIAGLSQEQRSMIGYHECFSCDPESEEESPCDCVVRAASGYGFDVRDKYSNPVGPNSNSFVAGVARHCGFEEKINWPFKASGFDYEYESFGPSPEWAGTFPNPFI